MDKAALLSVAFATMVAVTAGVTLTAGLSRCFREQGCRVWAGLFATFTALLLVGLVATGVVFVVALLQG